MSLTYAIARPSIQSGDLLALTHVSWASGYDMQLQLVRFGTQSEYVHVGLIWEIGGRLFVVESVQPLVRLVPLSNFAAAGFFWIPLDAPIGDAELERALAKVGASKYSKWQAILAFFKRLHIGADDLESCAEFVIDCRRLSGVDLGAIATPAAVVRRAQEAGHPVWYVKS